MKFGIAWVTTFATALGLGSSCASAQSPDRRYCIQGKSYAKGKELLQTRQLLVKVDGPPAPPDLLDMVVTQVARQKIWSEQGADVTVALEPFTEVVCGHALTATVSLKYDEQALQLLAQERGRGGPTTSEVSTQSVVTNPEKRTPPSGTPEGSRQLNLVEVYFATGRRATGNPSAKRSFGTQRADALTFGAVQVLIPVEHKMAKLESPSVLDIRWSNDANLHVALQDSYRTLQIQSWRTEIAKRANAFGKPGVLVFIHGYRNTFEDAARRAGQLAYDLAFAGPVVLFSWPSQGKASKYVADSQFASNAVRQLSDVIASLAEVDGKKQQVTIVAHSMGSRVLTAAVSDLLQKHAAYESTIGPIVLAAPDVSREDFKQRWLNDYGSAAFKRQFTMYASTADWPLTGSGALAGEQRLGRGGGDIAVFSPMVSIDASAVVNEFFGLNHSYFGDNRTVMSDLFYVVNGQLSPDKRAGIKKRTGPNGEYWVIVK